MTRKLFKDHRKHPRKFPRGVAELRETVDFLNFAVTNLRPCTRRAHEGYIRRHRGKEAGG